MIFQPGNCPVQGYEVRDGWLVYFRARDGWELRAWPPGTWRKLKGSDDLSQCIIDDYRTPSVYIDDYAEGANQEGFPVKPEVEIDYPGWWSQEYCEKVANWAISQVPELNPPESEEGS